MFDALIDVIFLLQFIIVIFFSETLKILPKLSIIVI